MADRSTLNIDSLYPLPEFDWYRSTAGKPHQAYLDYYDINFGSEKIRHSFGIKELAGYRIMVHYFVQEADTGKGTIVLNHGYMDHVGLYNHLLRALLHEGFSVLSYDLPGHGLSSGDRAAIAGFAEYQKVFSALMDEAKPLLSHPLYLVGQSTGCSIAMDYVLHNPDHGFDRLALMAPLVRPRSWWFIRMQLFLLSWLLNKVPRSFLRNSSDKEFLYFLKNCEPLQTRWIKVNWVKSLQQWIPHFQMAPTTALQTLIVQGHSDVTVDWEYNLPQIRRKFTQLTEKHIPEANHHLVKESKGIRQQVFSEVLRFLTS